MAYSFIRSITINHAEVGSSLTNYTLGFIGTYGWLANTGHTGHVQNVNGYDIIFTSDAAGLVTLPFERAIYNTVSGKVEFWIKVPAVSSTADTVIYILYGNAAITTDQATPHTAWDSNYLAVYHLGDGTTVDLSDSTGNNSAGTNHGATATTGDFGGALLFGGHGDHGDSGGSAWVDLGNSFNSIPVSVEVFGAPNNFSGGNTFISNVDLSGLGYEIHQPGGTQNWYVKLNGTDYAYPYIGFPVFTAHYYAFSFDGFQVLSYYVDEARNGITGSDAASLSITSASTLQLGKEPVIGANLFLGGTIDEVRISSNVRPLAYFEAVAENIFHTTDFYSIGAETAGPSGGTIVLNPNTGSQGALYLVAVAGTSTHFDGTTVVTISGTGATISSTVVTTATALTFRLALAVDATLGARTVTVTTGSEAPIATFTVIPLGLSGSVRGDIKWSQLALGPDGRWGGGQFGVSTDGSILAGDIPVMGGPDGKTLVGSGVPAASVSGASGGGAPPGPVNTGTGAPPVIVNGNPPPVTGAFTISGSVTPPPTGVRINITGTGFNSNTVTDASGNFTLTVTAAGVFTVTPSLPGWSFAPASKSVTVSINNVATAPFIPTAVPTGAGSNEVADQIFADMQGANEDHPHGVPSSYDFYSGPFIGQGNNIGSNTAIEWWGALYVGSAGNPATNTKVEVKDAQIWWLRASTGQWIEGMAPTSAIDGGYYTEDFVTDLGTSITFRSEGDGGVSFITTSGEVGHIFAPFPRITVDPSDFGGLVSVMMAKLVLDNGIGTDDRASANFLLEVGADFYPTTTGPGIENNPGVGGGKFKKVGTSYRSFSMTTLTQTQLRDNPPPVDFTGTTV
jgi:hypothetical protein